MQATLVLTFVQDRRSSITSVTFFPLHIFIPCRLLHPSGRGSWINKWYTQFSEGDDSWMNPSGLLFIMVTAIRPDCMVPNRLTGHGTFSLDWLCKHALQLCKFHLNCLFEPLLIWFCAACFNLRYDKMRWDIWLALPTKKTYLANSKAKSDDEDGKLDAQMGPSGKQGDEHDTSAWPVRPWNETDINKIIRSH